ncbi:MAG: acetoacetate--CoA ligase, partial [Pseudomonadota bacterium]
MTDPLWQPSQERIDHANLTAFMHFLADGGDNAPQCFDTLRDWSVDRPADFWASLWRFAGLKASRPWQAVLT